eukprot:augustus_masked-scaffold_12-processed-gene-12.84-mRNA-1 protein AED:0.01 eAED:0.01 QI:0/-1/0/1/-1/1/1/0/391
MEKIQVELGNRSYPIIFASLDHIGVELSGLNLPGNKQCVLISNTVVGPLYKEKVLQSLEENSWKASYIEIPDGEHHKNAETYINLVNSLLDLKIDRKTLIIALGGGVTTDIVGFAAATTLRGVPFVTVPTSLLAMVDASVGGKTGVNTKYGKNLLGAFWQPKAVFASLETLATLTPSEVRCGLGEVVKHAILDKDLFDYIESCYTNEAVAEYFNTFSEDSKKNEKVQLFLKEIVRRSCEIKARVVAADEKETSTTKFGRALLNLGHTVAHSVELFEGIENRNKLKHGEAVAVGTLAEIQLSKNRGKLIEEENIVGRFVRMLKFCGMKLGMDREVTAREVDELVAGVFSDKKREGATINLTTVRKVGLVEMEKVKPEDVRWAFEQLNNNKLL